MHIKVMQPFESHPDQANKHCHLNFKVLKLFDCSFFFPQIFFWGEFSLENL